MPNASGAEDEDQYRLARAYNNSIYLMVGVPYLLVGGIGFMIYRHVRVREAALARTLPPGPPLPQHPGVTPCPTRSPDEAS